MNSLVAFHNDPALKQKYIARVRGHRKAGRIHRDAYRRNSKRGAITATVNSLDYGAYEPQLGIPEALAHLESALFWELPPQRLRFWPEQFLIAISPGTNLSLVCSRMLYWLFSDPAGITQYTKKTDIQAMHAIAQLYSRRITGSEPKYKDWSHASTLATASYSAAKKASLKVTKKPKDKETAERMLTNPSWLPIVKTDPPRARWCAITALSWAADFETCAGRRGDAPAIMPAGYAAGWAILSEQLVIGKRAQTSIAINMADKLLELLKTA
jgi:hypothetical protein